MASVYSRLGSKVEIIEYLDHILPGMDKECSKELKKVLEKNGIVFHLSHAVQTVKATEQNTTIVYKSNESNE
jgi:dihydrolipoamide dehydrogenase